MLANFRTKKEKNGSKILFIFSKTSWKYLKKKTNNNNNKDYTTSGSGCQMLAQAAAVAVAMYNLRSTGVPRSATQTT